MSPNPFDLLFESADAKRARLFEIVAAANSSETLADLAAATVETFESIHPLQFGFLLLFAPPRLVVKARTLPLELERDLQTIEMPPAFFANPDEPHALSALTEQLKALTAPYQPATHLLVPLCAAQHMVGVLALAGTLTSDKRTWQAWEAHEEFLDAVGNHVGAAIQRFLEQDKSKERENELLNFLQNAEDGYWQTDGQGRITSVNEAALRTLKRPREQVMFKRIDELSDADPEGLRKIREALERDGGLRDFILKVSDSEGNVHTIRETMQVTRDLHGNPKGIHGIFRDITDELITRHQIEQSHHELRLLHELATGLNNTLGKQDMLDAGLDLILSLTRGDAIGIFLINQTEGHYDLAAHRGLEPELVQANLRGAFNRAIYKPNFDPETTSNLIEYMVLTQRIMTMNEFRAMPRFEIKSMLAFGYLSLLAFPMSFDKTVYGIVMVGSKQENAYDRRTLQVVESISAQLGLALRNQQLFVESQTQLRQMRTLTRTGRKIQYAPTAEEGLTDVIREIRQALNASYVVLQLLRQNRMQLVAASDERETRTTFTIAPYEQALLESDDPLIVNDTASGRLSPDHRAILKRLEMRAVIGVRLFAHSNPLGILFINQDHPYEWTPNDIQLVQRFALQIAYALENKRLLDEIKRQVSELHSLARAGRLIGAARTPDDALPAIAEEIARVFPADYVSFHLRDGEALQLIAESEETSAPRVLAIQPSQHIILDELEPTRVSNHTVDAVHPRQAEWLAKYKLVADLGVPLVSGKKALGILYISQHYVHVWTDAEVRLAETYATQITAALVNARLLRESQVQVSELKALARSADLIASSRSPETALPTAATELRRVLNADYVGFHFVEGNSLRTITEFNNRWSGFKYPIEPYHRAIMYHTNKIVVHDRSKDARDTALVANLERSDMRATVLVAMVSRGTPLGILAVSQTKPRQWQPGEVRLIETYAQQIAGVLDNVRLLEESTKRSHGLDQLARFDDIVVTLPDEASITELVLTMGADLLNVDSVSLTLIQDDKIVSGVNSLGEVYPEGLAQLTDWMRKVIDAKVPFAVDAEHPFEYDAMTQARAEFFLLRAILWVPMVTAHETIGLVCFSLKRAHVFTAEEKDMAQTVANQLATAYANARLFRAQTARISSLTEHSNFSFWCGTIRESAKLQAMAIERICRLVQASAGSIRLVDGDFLTAGVCYGFKHPELRDLTVPLSLHLKQVIVRRRSYRVNDIHNTPDVPEVWVKTHKEEGFDALLMIPMIAENEVLGIMTLYQGASHSWSEAEIQSAETLTNILALAISNTKQREKAEQKNDELQATLDSVFSGVFVTAAAGEIISWNHKAEEITGYNQDEMLGKHWDVDGPRVGSNRLDDRLVLEAMTENQVRFSVAPRYWAHPTGRQVLLRLVATPLHDYNGKIRGAVVAFWDRNQEQEGERAKVDFINEVAHELGNKMGPLIVASGQLLNTKLTEQRRTAYKQLLASFMDTLEAFHKRFMLFQTERVWEEIEVSEFNLKTMLQERVALLKAAKSGHTFRLTGDFDFVRADRRRLDTILENLLNNAVKYSTPGSRITIRGRCPSAGELELAIHNRGNPIPSEVQTHLFERGVRGDRSQPGRGLGLWLVQTKLQEIGGAIRFTSTARGGTTFFVTLRRNNHALPKPDAKDNLPGG